MFCCSPARSRGGPNAVSRLEPLQHLHSFLHVFLGINPLEIQKYSMPLSPVEAESDCPFEFVRRNPTFFLALTTYYIAQRQQACRETIY